MDYLFFDIATLLALWTIPIVWLYAAGFRYVLRVTRENDALREKLAKYEHPEPEPEWVKYLFSDGSDPQIPAVTG